MAADDYDPVLLRSAHVADALHAAAFWCVSAVVLVSPWTFASKEMWWFWPMAAALSLGCLFCGAATLVESVFLHDQDSPVRRHRIPARAFAAMASCAPFLAYAFLRAQFPSAPGFPLVRMEATRSLLRYFTPFALALVLVLSSRRRGRAALLRLFLADTFAMAAYGLWNHFHSADMNVLWVVPNEFYDFTYAGRISSSFFCPNHFSMWLDAAICVLLGAALAPGGRRRDRWLCALGAAALLPVNALTLSRGGVGALAIALFLLVPTLGLRGRRPLWRVLGTLGFAAAVAAGAFAVRYAAWTKEVPLGRLESVRFAGGREAETPAGRKTVLSYEDGRFRVRAEKGKTALVPAAELAPATFLPSPAATNEAGRFAVQVRAARTRRVDFAEPLELLEGGTLRYRVYNPVMNRLKPHPFWGAWERAGTDGGMTTRELLEDTFWYRFDRGQYIGAALRAWRSNPVWGIGPGQNEHRWPQFAATPDGVRAEPGRPETLKKPRLMNDGYHLYEVHSDWVQLLEEYGVVGFALFCIPLAAILVLLYMRQTAMEKSGAPALDRGLPLGVLLALGALAVQSAFDFSLQMPCIDWLFGFLVAAAILSSRHRG
ncbi:MAG: O-antigen ligase family protein [Kiritimatiellae bacterium]|nr:O-antigen ligase family protein [Kiritimatiellia bacterium]